MNGIEPITHAFEVVLRCEDLMVPTKLVSVIAPIRCSLAWILLDSILVWYRQCRRHDYYTRMHSFRRGLADMLVEELTRC